MKKLIWEYNHPLHRLWKILFVLCVGLILANGLLLFIITFFHCPLSSITYFTIAAVISFILAVKVSFANRPTWPLDAESRPLNRLTESRTFDLKQEDLIKITEETLKELGWDFLKTSEINFVANADASFRTWGQKIHIDILEKGTVQIQSMHPYLVDRFNKANITNFFDKFYKVKNAECKSLNLGIIKKDNYIWRVILPLLGGAIGVALFFLFRYYFNFTIFNIYLLIIIILLFLVSIVLIIYALRKK